MKGNTQKKQLHNFVVLKHQHIIRVTSRSKAKAECFWKLWFRGRTFWRTDEVLVPCLFFLPDETEVNNTISNDDHKGVSKN